MIQDALAALETYLALPRDVITTIVAFFEAAKENPTPRREVFQERRFFALVQENELTPLESSVIEAHKEFADLHVPVSAPEMMLFSPVNELALLDDRRPAEDVLLYRYDPIIAARIILQPGEFAFFHPDEGHAPCVAESDSPNQKIIKIVYKIHRELLRTSHSATGRRPEIVKT